MLSTKFAVSDRAGFPDRLGCADRWLPVGRQQDAEVVLVGHGRKAFEHVGEPGFGIVAVAFGAFDHGVDDGGMLPGNGFGDFVSRLEIGP
jgi:hypothetical protein